MSARRPRPAGIQWPNSAPGVFPLPTIIPPKLSHRQTFIILHGRGSFAAEFAPPLLETVTPSKETIQTAFPHAKLVFLTASRSKATIFKKSMTHQWFNGWHLTDYENRQELQREGLKKSCMFVHEVLKREIEEIRGKNVVLWGLSQGAATSLTSLLSWDGEPFAGVVGMCGYLPFCFGVEEIVDPDSGDDDDNPFATSGDEDSDSEHGLRGKTEEKDLEAEAISYLCTEIDMEDKTGAVYKNIPIFLGHGTADEKVPIELGRLAKGCLAGVGGEVEMREYEGLGHWYSEEMLGHIFEFLRSREGNEFGRTSF